MSQATRARFRASVEQAFRFLEEHGFRRLGGDDRDTPVGASVAYVGTHVGFLVTLDARDVVVDMRVVRVRAGRVLETGDGGYSCDLFTHLVEHAGYRGAPSGTPAAPGGAPGSRIERAVSGWAQLLRTAGETLLKDEEGALPV